MSRSSRVRVIWISLVACFLLLGTVGALFAEPATKKLRVLAKQVISEKHEGKIQITTLDTAQIFHEDAHFKSDTIVMRSQNDVHEFTCTGNPVFTDPENRITSDRVIGYSSPRRAEFINNVVMKSTPKKKAESDSEMKGEITGKPTTTTCDRLSYDYAGKRAQATGHVVVKQESRTLWADEGIYEQELELITLRGNIRMKNTGEEELKELKDVETATISLENDWIDMVAKPDGFIQMDFEVKDEE